MGCAGRPSWRRNGQASVLGPELLGLGRTTPTTTEHCALERNQTPSSSDAVCFAGRLPIPNAS